jgi:hypothetical protein
MHDWLLTQYKNLREFHITYSIIGATIVAVVGARLIPLSQVRLYVVDAPV